MLATYTESGPVSALELNSTSDTTLLISWGEPVSPNGNILSYSITITDLRDDSTVRSENRGAEETTSFMETNLGEHILCYNIGVGSGGARGRLAPPKFQVGGASPPQLYPLFT